MGIYSGVLKAKFNVHEVVSTIMMNWIAYWIVYYMVPMYFKGEFLETESAQLPAKQTTLRIQALTDFFPRIIYKYRNINCTYFCICSLVYIK